MSKLNQGELALTLEGERVVLKVTIEAIRSVSREFNGMIAARQAVAAQRFDACLFVLAVGLGLTAQKDIDELELRLFRNGMTGDLLVGLIDYLAIVANGGRHPKDETGDTIGQTSGNG